jgi:hypothetical protein
MLARSGWKDPFSTVAYVSGRLGVTGEIRGSSAHAGVGREDVPEDFTDADDERFHFWVDRIYEGWGDVKIAFDGA